MDAAENLVFVDLETTGGNAAHHRITEIGIVRVANGAVVEEWSSLVNPGCEIPSYIVAFTGISNEMVAAAPRFAALAATVFDKLRGAVFVAHNARFDYSFLGAEFRRVGMHFAATALCTVKLSRRLFPQHARHNLDAVMERHELACNARHRALGDALVLRDFWFKLRLEIPAAEFAAAQAQSVLGVVKLPEQLPPELADELPEGPGVYRFFGADDALLYVGRSNSLRSRVLAQLGDQHPGSRDRKLAAQVRRVDWRCTAGELGAVLLEAEWIKTQQPLYNRHLSRSSEAVTLRLAAGHLGLLETQRIEALAPADLADSFGVFHSAKDARKALTDIARARELCLKVMGLEQSEGSCFALQVGKCRGACTGKEPLLLHQVRIQLALSALKIKRWPFPGRVGLREGDEIHVLDHWTYLGTARSEEELAALSAREADVAFDVDVYKVLMRYLSSHASLDWQDLRVAVDLS
ncbi:MAG TPA: exonuclease domain-containing protein [Steroidobacteraceae bacterium]|nr:exonuclease domain-containing protein [Steroidobacteraceae bacterium]